MRKLQRKKYLLLFSAILLLHNLVYLPGPEFLYFPAMIAAFGGAFCAVIALLVLPVATIWTLVERKNALHRRYGLQTIFFSATMVLSAFVGSRLTMPLGRAIAMHRAAPIIHYVEGFNKRNGYYPRDLSLMKDIPSSFVVGVDGYQYEPIGLSYKISFTQIIPIINAEVVMYQPNDQHKAEGEHDTLYSTGHPHWKYYIYD